MFSYDCGIRPKQRLSPPRQSVWLASSPPPKHRQALSQLERQRTARCCHRRQTPTDGIVKARLLADTAEKDGLRGNWLLAKSPIGGRMRQNAEGIVQPDDIPADPPPQEGHTPDPVPTDVEPPVRSSPGSRQKAKNSRSSRSSCRPRRTGPPAAPCLRTARAAPSTARPIPTPCSRRHWECRRASPLS